MIVYIDMDDVLCDYTTAYNNAIDENQVLNTLFNLNNKNN
jgi:hypothetical protein